MPLRLSLLFNFNQHLTEFARVASHNCYRGLLQVLRAHPTLPVNIQISGTLIHALQWLDPEPLELIRAGIDEGQFELLGSTYAQNVAYASDDWDNAQQIELHKEVLRDTFNVEPVAFWNPGGSWRQSLAPLIVSAGYQITLIEDHILDQAGLAPILLASVVVDGNNLTVVRESVALRHSLIFAALFGQPEQLISKLQSAPEADGTDERFLAIAVPAEAMGLWGWHENVLPHPTWQNLDRLLTALESDDAYEFVQLSKVSRNAQDLKKISPVQYQTGLGAGAAAALDDALHRKEAPHYEEGFDSWFHYLKTSPDVKRFGRMYSRLRQRLVDSVVDAPAGAQALHRSALHTFLAHQHNYGTPGVGGSAYRGWEGARSALSAIRAADFAKDPEPFMLVEDVTGEGYDEVLVCDGRDLLVLAPGGGRLLYWFDLETGCQYVGNQLAVFDLDYEGDAIFPVRETIWKPWLPENWDLQAQFPEVVKVREAPPTRFAGYLPDWVWNGSASFVTLAVREMELWNEVEPLPAQRRAIVDYISVDGSEIYDPDDDLDYRFENGHVIFIRFFDHKLTLEKHYALANGQVEAHYRFLNQDAHAHKIELRVANELCPDYATVMRAGRAALAFDGYPETPTVRNINTDVSVRISADRAWHDSRVREALFALEVETDFTFDVAPESETTFTFTLERSGVD